MYRLKNCFRKYSAKIKKNKYEFQINDKYICSCVSTVQGFDEYERSLQFFTDLLNSHKSREMEQIGDGMKTQRS